MGLLAALALSRVMASQLHGVEATDPLTYVVTAAGLSLVAALASWLPARRATLLEPSEVLRGE